MLLDTISASISLFYPNPPPASAPPTLSLDFHAYPHLLDAIIAHADKPTRLALRATSHDICDRIDALLFRHVAYRIRRPDPPVLASPTSGKPWFSLDRVTSGILRARDIRGAPILAPERALRLTRTLDLYAPALRPLAARVRHLRRFSAEFDPPVGADVLVDHIHLPPLRMYGVYLPVGSEGHAHVGARRHVLLVEYAAQYGSERLHDGTLVLPHLADLTVFILRPVREWAGGPPAASPDASFFGTLVRSAARHRALAIVGVEETAGEILGLGGVGNEVLPFEIAVHALYAAAKRIVRETPGATLRSCVFLTHAQYRSKVGREAYELETERWWVSSEDIQEAEAEHDPFLLHPSLFAVS
ncbi:hypothetical protein CC85DRAFT_304436 [Cutaneotrichosporon oleaginosum]|uniref:Uncharacterized protein n=1 Tax=Cutaneotrichosporon oleaginosum TaxID=879819 RepID=A0A0J0XGC7_9TREE|nr:uncharacterized protein CC85DRAFT_304436 [Cutaneotrichosporon oleaginosum]KLT40116.1 hypothetical protein CC85DRAFT_304436 [Cutaneotrichosporon oleaginosum]TXT04754.1 hypothetical protein COLE_07573 [Cutaneotrichosporon oleaginosum]